MTGQVGREELAATVDWQGTSNGIKKIMVSQPNHKLFSPSLKFALHTWQQFS